MAKISEESKEKALDQLSELQRNLSYDTKDYTVELLAGQPSGISG